MLCICYWLACRCCVCVLRLYRATLAGTFVVHVLYHMCRILLTLFVWFLSGVFVRAQTYVSPDGSGGGTSWADPSSLADAIANASNGDELWLERSEEHTSELQSRENLVCRLLLEKKKINCEDIAEYGDR